MTTVTTDAGSVRWQIDELTSQQHLRGTYEPYMQRAFTQYARPGSVVYDIGAHAGFHTLFCGLLVGSTGRVIAFEPSSENRASLERQCQLNTHLAITVLPFAVADRSGRMAFDTTAGNSQGRLASHGSVVVEVRTLDSLVADGTIPAPSVVKLDVEGSEEEVLRGATYILKRYRPVILCDIDDDNTAAMAERVLGPLGYDMVESWPVIAVPRHGWQG